MVILSCSGCSNFGFSISFLDSLAISGAGLLAYVSSITPAALGVREAAMALVAAAAGVNFTQAIAAVTLDRILLMILIFPLGLYYLLKYRNKFF